MTEGVAPAAPRKGPRFRTSVIVLVLGVVVAIPGILVFGLALSHALHGPIYEIPGATRLGLGEGTYIVFERTGENRSYGPVEIRNNRGPSIEPGRVVVTDSGGTRLAVDYSSTNETIDRGSAHYASAVEFTTPRSGVYTVRVRAAEPGQIIVQRPLFDVFSRRVPWAIEIAVGWVIGLVGMTMLLTGVIRRGRADRRTRTFIAASTLPAAAWFPDPNGVRRLRYWDGHAWTDHVAD